MSQVNKTPNGNNIATVKISPKKTSHNDDSDTVKVQQQYNKKIMQRRVRAAHNVGETAQAVTSKKATDSVAKSAAKSGKKEDPAYTVDQKAYTHYLKSLETHLKENNENYRKSHTWQFRHDVQPAAST